MKVVKIFSVLLFLGLFSVVLGRSDINRNALLSFEPLETGVSVSDSRFSEIGKSHILFEDRATWDEFASKYDLPAADVDFSTQKVLAVFGMECPSSGYSIAVRRIEYIGDTGGLYVNLIYAHPFRGDATLSVMTYPTAFVVFDAPAAPIGRVGFNSNNRLKLMGQEDAR